VDGVRISAFQLVQFGFLTFSQERCVLTINFINIRNILNIEVRRMGFEAEILKPTLENTTRFAVYDGYNCRFLEYSNLMLHEDEMREYEANNQYPKEEEEYSFEDCIAEFTAPCDGSITINVSSEKTMNWILDMIRALVLDTASR